jgi:riboflavin synthase
VFSGIVGSVGAVLSLKKSGGGLRLTIGHTFSGPAEIEPGASVAVSGVCLTVERSEAGQFEATAVEETLSKTTLGALAAGDRVNLERALRVGDELGGHWVQGHVDAVGGVVSVERSGGDVRVSVEAPIPVRRFIAAKGAVSLDGMSLTIAKWADPIFTVALVPYTVANTIASGYKPGTRVNLEADLIARYLDRLLDESPAGREAGTRRGTLAPARPR